MSATPKLTAAKLRFYDALTAAPGVTHLTTRVAWRLLHHHNFDARYAWPSYTTLAQEVHSDRRTVIRCIERLETQGWFTVERPKRRGRGRRFESGHVWKEWVENTLYRSRKGGQGTARTLEYPFRTLDSGGDD